MSRPKIDKVINSRQSFKKFKKDNPKLNITYATFSKILQRSGEMHSQKILEGGNIKLPNRLGNICIVALPLRIKSKGDIVLPINWKESKRINSIVYHTNSSTGKYFHVEWANYSYDNVPKYWKFIPNRLTVQRRIKDFIDKVEYYNKINLDERL